MKCAFKMRLGTEIAVDGDNLFLKSYVFADTCTIKDVIAIRFTTPTFWSQGTIYIITKKSMEIMRIAHNKKPTPFAFAYNKDQILIYKQFFQEFLGEIRRCKGSEGTLVDGWWTWPEEDAHAPEPAAQPAAQPEAEAPAPAAPPVDAQPAQPAAAAGPDLEQAIRDKVAGEKKQAGPACPDCGCTSIFADKDETGTVVITCLNCGRKWHPGEHRSW